MKRFEVYQLAQAIQWARDGGQALIEHRGGARVYDQDARRLRRLAASFGAPDLPVSCPGSASQHVNLFGGAARRARRAAERSEEMRLGGATTESTR